MMRLATAVLSMLLCALNAQDSAPLADTTSDGHLAPLLKNLGHLHAPVTTKSPDAQRYFDQGLTLVYAFNHAEALRSFKEVARLDPDCAMAYWGQALALAPNINDPAIGPDREQQGHDAAAEAVKRKKGASARETALIDAMAARFASAPPQGNRSPLNHAYARAMTSVYLRFPADPDVAVLYADSVLNTRPWDYWNRAGQPRPGFASVRAALEKAIRAFPDHPGARHLYIHLMEASNEVDLATPSAEHLPGLVPAAGHLVHMPGHIYIRVGRYADAAEANVRAIAADEDYITQCRAQGIYPAAYYPHNIHFLNAALVMDGRSAEALESARKVASKHDHAAMQQPGFGFAHLLKSLPVLTLVRFGRWDDILAEPAFPDDMPFEEGMRHFGRGFAFAASDRMTEAAAELQALRKIAADPSLKEQKIFDVNSLGQIASIGEAMLTAEIALKSGGPAKAIAGYVHAVALEDRLLYSEPPDWPLSPRQYLGQAYMAAGQFKSAERTYRADLKRHRANGWSLFGLEQSLRKQGRTAEAGEVQKQFATAWKRSDIQLAASRF